MDDTLNIVDEKARKMYRDVLTPLGNQYQMHIYAPRQQNATKPTVLFLGNHSSGKSTFINYLLNEKVQKTGVAPTDDGFTVLTYGDQPQTSTGPAAAMRPEITFTELDRFGPAFLARLKLKIMDNELLKDINLVDSPGMIDAATTAQERGYDFMSAVRCFGDSADLILFFLDPEKPGTTGETIAAFTRGLSGMENKVLILMNKADTFETIRDFARDYGALCWNLSRVIQTKDMPEIYTTYIPLHEGMADQHRDLPLDGFDDAREEVIREVRQARNRRLDNVISTVWEQANRLDMHIKVVSAVKQSVRGAQLLRIIVALVLLDAPLALGYYIREAANNVLLGSLIGVGIVVAVVWWFISRALLKRYELSLIAGIDATFERVYEANFALGQHDDLTARWMAIREGVKTVLEVIGLNKIPSTHPRWNGRYRKLQQMLKKGIAQLRTNPTG